MSGESGPVEMLLELDRGRGLPLHEQLERSLRTAIREGRLHAGAQLPSTRALASELGVSRGIVTAAYEALSLGSCPQGQSRSGSDVPLCDAEPPAGSPDALGESSVASGGR